MLFGYGLALAVTMFVLYVTANVSIEWMKTTKETIGVKHLVPLIIVATLALLCWIWVFPKIFAPFQ